MIILFWVGFCITMVINRIIYNTRYLPARDYIRGEIKRKKADSCLTCKQLYQSTPGECLSCIGEIKTLMVELNSSIPFLFCSTGISTVMWSFAWPLTLSVIVMFEIGDRGHKIVHHFFLNVKSHFIKRATEKEISRIESEMYLQQLNQKKELLEKQQLAKQQLHEIQSLFNTK